MGARQSSAAASEGDIERWPEESCTFTLSPNACWIRVFIPAEDEDRLVAVHSIATIVIKAAEPKYGVGMYRVELARLGGFNRRYESKPMTGVEVAALLGPIKGENIVDSLIPLDGTIKKC